MSRKICSHKSPNGLSNKLKTLEVFIATTLLWLTIVAPGEPRILHSSKGTLKLLKTSSSSLLHQSSSAVHHHGRYKREAGDGDYFDENFDVIPVMSDDSPKTIGDHLSEQARKIAESFSNMWQSVAESIRRCVDAIRVLFSSDEEAFELTPEQEEQMRAAMEARAKAIEEQNEIYRNFQENQL